MATLYKVLNRLKLLKYINVASRIKVGTETFKIPIINGLGLKNLNHKTTWIEHLLSNFNNQNHPLVILDVGVNIGQTLISIKSLNPKWEYIGFEPNPNCVYYVNKLIKANNFSNTSILPFAISNKIEGLDLYLNHETDSTATTLEAFRPKHYEQGFKELVMSFDLDSLTKNYLNINKIDILKIDIEGSELFALKGAKVMIELYKPIIICEVLDTHSTETLANHKKRLQSLEKLLNEMNYKVYQIIRNETDTEVIDYKLIHSFEIKIWDLDSLKLNDYLFISNENLNKIKKHINLTD